ncbi:ATP-binding protein [Pseudenhygromyxa sp. WMMC2535]|uniref:ATP-binding protein n=1 Tax=Pseudenhygromyxa sp. WMMC2535 TaxID=2712867 RepID=UPI00155716E2|nr:ATP-binding protein [Pseudenhygromyxa sp. WMMC2535]NVB41269.1 ATP-binding protein [Pseudenhygromyxa sp. WMMC2535]
MKAEPAGAVATAEAIGREADTERLWAALSEGGVILEGRWGMGKTTLIRLALAATPAGWFGRRVALAELPTPLAAAAAIIDALWQDHPGPGPALEALVTPLLGAGGEVTADELGLGDGEHEDGWEAVLRDCVDAVMQAELGEAAPAVVLALDDFDRFCAQMMAKGFGPSLGVLVTTIAELLDSHAELRLLISCGASCDRLFERVYPRLPSAAFDSFARVRVESLSPESGARLATALLLGESIAARDRAATARRIAASLDGVPRWIHCAMAELARRHEPVTEADLEQLFTAAAASVTAEPWALGRELAPVLEDYWEPQRGLALAILDALCGAEDGAFEFRELRRRLAVQMTIDDDAIQRVVEVLLRDQIIENIGGRLRFYGDLLRRGWMQLRGL